MNDISVKIVDFVKEQTGVDFLPSVETVPNNEVDPLAIDDAKVKETEVAEAERERVPDVKQEVEEKAGSCDQNAKDENLSGRLEKCANDLKVQTEQLKGISILTVVHKILFNCIL